MILVKPSLRMNENWEDWLVIAGKMNPNIKLKIRSAFVFSYDCTQTGIQDFQACIWVVM